MRDNYPLITIIIATYNSDKTLKKCIQSIIAQTYKNYELIIIDGASIDHTTDILIEYDANIAKWISEKDSGIYDAWNKGIKFARGEWIAFLGSDDKFYSEALSQYVHFICENKSVDYISSKMDLVTENDIYIKTIGTPWNWKRCRLQNSIAHPGSMHSRRLFENNEQFNTNYKICSDYEFLLRQGENMKSAFLNKITVRMAQGGASFNIKKLFEEHYKIVRTTGNLNVFSATYYYIWLLLKNYLKIIIRKFRVNI